MEWIALRHVALVHLPITAALLAPIALIASQRAGRGHRPWWTAARFLILMGALGSLVAAFAGFAHLRLTGLGGGWRWSHLLGPTFRHPLLALLSLPLGAAALRFSYRKRQEHQGIGVLPLFLGCLWSAALLTAAHYAEPARVPAVPQAVQAPEPPKPPPDLEAETPVRALDHQRLAAMHLEPVKSPPHGNRWIRAWVTPGAAEAYALGRPLPPGAIVVLSTFEDRWGRPGYDAGPLYYLETLPEGGQRLGFYWPQVPEAKRGETGGQGRVYLRGNAPGLQSCMACHANGTAPLRDRSQWKVPRRPKAEDTESNPLSSARP